MVTDFQNSFTGRLSSKFLTKLCLNVPPHLKCVSAVPCEMLCSKTAMLQNWVKRTAMQTQLLKHFMKSIYPATVMSFFHWGKDIYNGHSKKLAEWPTLCTWTSIMCVSRHLSYWLIPIRKTSQQNACTHMIDAHSVMASVGKSQVIDSTQISHLPITESRLVRSNIITRCC